MVTADSEIKRDDPVNDPTQYRHVKRPAVHAPTRKHDIYCTQHTHFNRLYKHALHLLLHQQLHSIRIHGLGKAVEVANKLVAKLEQLLTSTYITLHPTISTTLLYDDYLPLQPHLPPITRCRFSSSICIEVRIKEQGNIPLALSVATGMAMPSVDFASTINSGQQQQPHDRKQHAGQKYRQHGGESSSGKKHKHNR